MFSLPTGNWWRLGVWLAIGLIIYFLYGRRHSVMAQQAAGASPQPGPSSNAGSSAGSST
ncbi:MAG: amino acid permease C-terminal domain-containing protein [Myxococcales bacterium]